jgi:hypothetical protein
MGTCQLDLDVTRSPCPVCADAIVGKKRDVERNHRRIVIRVAAYRPYSPETEAQQGLRTLAGASIPVTVRTITTAERRELTPDERRRLSEEQARLQELIELEVGDID